MAEKKIKYIEMIETIIERMAKNSFQLKGWSMTLIALVGAISAQGSDKRFILLAFIPIIGFWIDAVNLPRHLFIVCHPRRCDEVREFE